MRLNKLPATFAGVENAGEENMWLMLPSPTFFLLKLSSIVIASVSVLDQLTGNAVFICTSHNVPTLCTSDILSQSWHYFCVFLIRDDRCSVV